VLKGIYICISPFALCCRVPFVLCVLVFLGILPMFFMLLWLYVGLRLCDVLFSRPLLPAACPGIKFFVSIGAYNELCIGDVFECFLTLCVGW
jgi:hypothetical protein